MAGGRLILISDLLTPISAAQFRTTFVNVLSAFGINASAWVKGGTASTILTATSQTCEGFNALMVQGLSSAFLETATGGWLTLLAYFVYGVTRPPATFATGTVTLTNTGGGVYNYGPGQVTFLDVVTKQTYTNVAAIALGALATLAGVPLIATTAGAASSAQPGDISELVTVMLGVEVTNPEAVVGSDAMTDANLRLLCVAALAANSPYGPANAYRYAALSATRPDGSPVNVNRVSVTPFNSTGAVTVTIASPSGAPIGLDLSYVDAAIKATGPNAAIPFGAVPAAVTETTAAAVAVPYAPTITVWCLASPTADPSAIAAAASTAITDYLTSYPIGGVSLLLVGTAALWGSGIEAAIGAGVAAATGQTVVDIVGVTDLPLTGSQVAAWAGTVNARLVHPS